MVCNLVEVSEQALNVDVVEVSAQALTQVLTIACDPAAQSPVYIYLSPCRGRAAYSYSVTALLNHPTISKPLHVSSSAVNFLIQNGVVPPPKTIYQDIFILSLGHSVTISSSQGSLAIDFKEEFPFKNKEGKEKYDENHVLELLASATIKEIESDKASYLFHSAGKDSNMIALAMAAAGYQDKFTSLTYAAAAGKDESKIAAEIAKKLGIKHIQKSLPKQMTKQHRDAIGKYFSESPFPCTDRAALLYPVLSVEIDEKINLIDGMGNDVYIGHIPPLAEYNRQARWKLFDHFSAVLSLFPTESVFSSAQKTRAEWCGLSGFNKRDSQRIVKDFQSSREYWRNLSRSAGEMDYLTFRAQVRGAIIDTEVFSRKVRNAGDVCQWNVIFPWAAPAVAEYFFSVDADQLFDRHMLKNKLVLRSTLKERAGLDSDAIGKIPYGFDSVQLLMELDKTVTAEVLSCKYWLPSTKKILQRLLKQDTTDRRVQEVRHLLLYRLYVVSAWLNHNRYIN